MKTNPIWITILLLFIILHNFCLIKLKWKLDALENTVTPSFGSVTNVWLGQPEVFQDGKMGYSQDAVIGLRPDGVVIWQPYIITATNADGVIRAYTSTPPPCVVFTNDQRYSTEPTWGREHRF